jgi:RNA polymerase sigma factor (sigma-70 family)
LHNHLHEPTWNHLIYKPFSQLLNQSLTWQFPHWQGSYCWQGIVYDNYVTVPIKRKLNSETDIILRLKKGDPKALTYLFRMHHNALYSFAAQLIKNGQEASDIVAAAFLKLWQNSAGFEDMTKVQSFLYLTTHDACRNYLKHADHPSWGAAPVSETELSGDFIQSQLIRAGLFQKILSEVESLPPMRRKIFNMTYLEGMNVFEIATRLNISVDSVRVQKIKALHFIRTAFLRKFC